MDNLNQINNGALFESFVAEELYNGCGKSYCYKKKSAGEVDFMIENDGMAIPIEVKSGSDYKKHAALDHLLENHSFNTAYILSPNNVETDGIKVYLTIYMAGFVASGTQNKDVVLEKIFSMI